MRGSTRRLCKTSRNQQRIDRLDGCREALLLISAEMLSATRSSKTDDDHTNAIRKVWKAIEFIESVQDHLGKS